MGEDLMTVALNCPCGWSITVSGPSETAVSTVAEKLYGAHQHEAMMPKMPEVMTTAVKAPDPTWTGWALAQALFYTAMVHCVSGDWDLLSEENKNRWHRAAHAAIDILRDGADPSDYIKPETVDL